MANGFSEDQNRMLAKLIGLRSNHPYDHKTSASFFCPMANHKNDKNPSFNVNFHEGIYHCFGCGASGTIRGLCKELRGKSAAELLGLSSSSGFHFTQNPNYKPFSLEDKIKEDTKYEEEASLSVRGVALPYYRVPKATSYLESRAIERREADAMKMQYVEEAYINGTYFKERLLVPVYNSKGNVINIEGRDVTRKQQAKCLYPKGTIKTIYEHWKLDKEKPLFIVEGLMDLAVLRSDDFFANSSAIFGVQVTSYQISLLNTFKEVILIPDNDEAGRMSIELLKSRLQTHFSVWKIGSSFIKDVGEIPLNRITVKELRESEGFIKCTNLR